MASLTPEQIAASGTEQGAQTALMAYAASVGIDCIFAIRNEEKSGSKIRGSIAKAAGVRSGVPDTMIAKPMQGYAGLFIELKVGKNTISSKQAEWHERLRRNGYCVRVCWGYEQARDVLKWYMGIE